MLSYLTLYYCRLPHAQGAAFVILALWLGLLFSTIGIAASDFFCVNLSTISQLLGMSESMAGVTFLAFGNGSPDVFSTFAAMNSHSGSLAVGELIGAASFITAVVAGSMALVRPFQVARKSFVRDVSFFVVAVSFSLSFLADGKLRLWECATMVGFYVFYVAIVVLWHWWLTSRRRQGERITAARGQYYVSGSDELEPPEEYHDDDTAPPSRMSLSRANTEDFDALESGNAQPEYQEISGDDQEELRERWMSELSSNMRLSRPSGRERSNSINPIRPSLVGALEFRAVLSSLEKSRNIQTYSMGSRRYSDDPNYTTAQQQHNAASPLEPDSEHQGDLAGRAPGTSAGNRALGESVRPGNNRAVTALPRITAQQSAPDAASKTPQIDLLLASPPSNDTHLRPPISSSEDRHDGSAIASGTTPSSPKLSVTPPPSHCGSRDASQRPARDRSATTGLLTPNQNTNVGHHQPAPPGRDLHGYMGDGQARSRGTSPKTRPGRPKLRLPMPENKFKGGTATSPFPFHDLLASASSTRPPSLVLPPPSATASTSYHEEPSLSGKPLKWWPYRFLPSPAVVLSTLFPTLYTWQSKSLWDRFLGIVAAPSVFVLTITLPVVEAERDDGEDILQTHEDVSANGEAHRKSALAVEPSHTPHGNHGMGSPAPKGYSGHGNTATTAADIEDGHGHQEHALDTNRQPPSVTQDLPSTSKDWNQWLVLVQCFTSPLFLCLVVWANTTAEPLQPRTLVRPVLYCLIFSFAVVLFILTTTTPTRSPRWRVLLCFVGFAVSIGWISTIANEVVGVLKTFGVILNISDAILGLTIFAVGNSLGDLVADITVARLGYPVMALSACFGGPMLNILLGIGLSGLYHTIRGAEHRHHKHPDRPIKYSPYEIEISRTIMISAVTLLFTLLALLVLIPLNGWRMDKRIGWGLVALWCISTLGNVIVEIVGWGGDIA